LTSEQLRYELGDMNMTAELSSSTDGVANRRQHNTEQLMKLPASEKQTKLLSSTIGGEEILHDLFHRECLEMGNPSTPWETYHDDSLYS